jgi:hypothetical protein
VAVYEADKRKRMDAQHTESAESGVVHQAHTLDFIAKVIIGVAVVLATYGSLVLNATQNLGPTATIIIAALLTLVITQLPIMIPWGRRYFVLWRSRYPWMSTVIAVVLVSFVLFNDHFLVSREMIGPVGPAGPQGDRGIPGPQGSPGISDPRIASAVNAMTRLAWLEPRYEAFKEKKAQLISELQAVVDAISKNPLGSGKPPSAEPGWSILARNLSQMAKEDFGWDGNFDMQPLLAFGQHNSENAAHNLEKAQSSVKEIDLLYSNAISRLQQQIRSFGKNAPNAPN